MRLYKLLQKPQHILSGLLHEEVWKSMAKREKENQERDKIAQNIRKKLKLSYDKKQYQMVICTEQRKLETK